MNTPHYINFSLYFTSFLKFLNLLFAGKILSNALPNLIYNIWQKERITGLTTDLSRFTRKINNNIASKKSSRTFHSINNNSGIIKYI